MYCRSTVLSSGSLPESEEAKLRFQGRKPDMDLLYPSKSQLLCGQNVSSMPTTTANVMQRNATQVALATESTRQGATVWLLFILFQHKKIGRTERITQGHHHRAALS